jgi:hypothetical protein
MGHLFSPLPRTQREEILNSKSEIPNYTESLKLKMFEIFKD